MSLGVCIAPRLSVAKLCDYPSIRNSLRAALPATFVVDIVEGIAKTTVRAVLATLSLDPVIERDVRTSVLKENAASVQIRSSMTETCGLEDITKKPAVAQDLQNVRMERKINEHMDDERRRHRGTGSARECSGSL
jgi:hypothetical protein